MDEKKILFSIIIPAYNEETVLPTCLKSLEEQQVDFGYEVIVVDNNSKDNTAKIARDWGARIIIEKKQGVGYARKAGTDSARGKYVLHIDADSRLPGDYLWKVKAEFGKDKELVCLGGQMYFYNGVWWQNMLRPFFHRVLWLFAALVSRGKVGPMGNNMTFRKEDYNKTSGFDTRLKYGEDMDLCRKLHQFGKIKLDMSLKCFVSSRRYKINKQLFEYFFNFLKMSVFGKPYKNVLPHTKYS